MTARLVTSDEGLLEIATKHSPGPGHDYADWLDDDVDGQRILHHLSATADAWDSLGRPESELYRGVRLARTLEWREQARPSLTTTETDFLEASGVAAELAEQSAAEHARTQARLIKRLRLVLTGAVVLLVLALAAGGVAAVQTERARDKEATAEAAALSALARNAAARAGSSGDIATALLLGAAAVRLEESPETLNSLTGTLAENPALVASAPLEGETAAALDVHPDGHTVAAIDTLRHVRLIDLASGDQVADRQLGGGQPSAVDEGLRFSTDGTFLAVGATLSTRRPVVLLDADTLQPLPEQPTGLARRDWAVRDLHISQDSRTVAALLMPADQRPRRPRDQEIWAYVWRLDDLAHPTRIDLTAEDIPERAVLSPSGQLLYTSGTPVQVHHLATGRVRALHPGEGGLDISPDGRLLALQPAGTRPYSSSTRAPAGWSDGWASEPSRVGRDSATTGRASPRPPRRTGTPPSGRCAPAGRWPDSRSGKAPLAPSR